MKIVKKIFAWLLIIAFTYLILQVLWFVRFPLLGAAALFGSIGLMFVLIVSVALIYSWAIETIRGKHEE